MTDPRGATIHDLGYQRYDGPVVGSGGAWQALFVQGVRAMFGLGRPAKAKVVPVFVVGMTLLQALGQVAIAGATNGQAPIRYGVVFQSSVFLFALFAAAQAPEILSRDQQHRLLPLLFTRSITRTSYASARLGALVASIFGVVLTSLLLLYLGQIGIAADPAKEFGKMGSQIFPVFAMAGITALTLGGISGAISVLTPRRAYATAAIIALLLVLTAISNGVSDLVGVASQKADLINVLRSLRILCMLLFDEKDRGMESQPPLDTEWYVGLALGIAAIGAALLWRRVRKLEV